MLLWEKKTFSFLCHSKKNYYFRWLQIEILSAQCLIMKYTGAMGQYMKFTKSDF